MCRVRWRCSGTSFSLATLLPAGIVCTLSSFSPWTPTVTRAGRRREGEGDSEITRRRDRKWMPLFLHQWSPLAGSHCYLSVKLKYHTPGHSRGYLAGREAALTQLACQPRRPQTRGVRAMRYRRQSFFQHSSRFTTGSPHTLHFWRVHLMMHECSKLSRNVFQEVMIGIGQPVVLQRNMEWMCNPVIKLRAPAPIVLITHYCLKSRVSTI